MRKIGSTIATAFSVVALGSCTAIGCYEFYNSYLTETPKNIISYHNAATAQNADKLATEDNAEEETATSKDAWSILDEATASDGDAYGIDIEQ